MQCTLNCPFKKHIKFSYMKTQIQRINRPAKNYRCPDKFCMCSAFYIHIKHDQENGEINFEEGVDILSFCNDCDVMYHICPHPGCREAVKIQKNKKDNGNSRNGCLSNFNCHLWTHFYPLYLKEKRGKRKRDSF